MEISIPQWRMATELFIESACKAPSNTGPEKTSGFLYVVTNNFSRIQSIQVGNPPVDTANRYLRFSQEKAHRLYSDWLRDSSNTVSSWQTRQPEMNRWGGAVLFTPSRYSSRTSSCDIVSFSGLPELVDEAVSLRLGYHFGLVTDKEFARKVTSISDNKIFHELRN